jgi:putative ABC transport system permease protein
VGWYIMHMWLQNFAYRIHMSGWVFVLTGAITLFIATATIVLQALKSIMQNPVKNLRTE